MRSMFRAYLVLLALLAPMVFGQAITTTVVNGDGLSVVEQITTNAAGAPIGTQVISTISSTPDQQGPVGAPTTTSNGPAPPTTFVYTTTVNGVKTVLTSVFTPTYMATSPATYGTAGTVLAYSDYTKQFTQPRTGGTISSHPFELFTLMGMTSVALMLGVLCVL